MLSLMKYVAFVLAGLALSGLGLSHAVAGYPGPAVFARLAADLPTLGAVALFAGAVAAAAVGLALLAVSARRLRAWRRARSRPQPVPAAARSYRDPGAYPSTPAYRDAGYGGTGYGDRDPDPREWDPRDRDRADTYR